MPECACDICQKACITKPGVLAPGDAEKIASFLGISVNELFDKYLVVDWYEPDSQLDETFFLAPGFVGRETGTMAPAKPTGQCVFFTEDRRCVIHPVKPKECRKSMHTQGMHQAIRSRFKIIQAWVKHQEQLETLLGATPTAREYNVFDMLKWDIL